LTERQAMVLRALVSAYVGQAAPVASTALSHLMPKALSPASVRNTLGELHEAGLIEKAHASAGRIPTALGLRIFVDHLLELGDLGPHHQRLLDREFDGLDAAETPRQASHLLSEHTRQLGFVVAPRVERLRLRTLHLVPVATGRILAVLVAENGGVIERFIEDVGPISARELECVRAHLAERIEGRTLLGLRRLLERESENLRGEADGLLRQAWELGLRACEDSSTSGVEDLVIATRLALLDQPEFSDPDRIRGLFNALETNQRLLDLLRQIARADSGEMRIGLSMSLGAELGEPSLKDCVLIAVPYGSDLRGDARNGDLAGGALEMAPDPGALGVLGVIGPQRMDYGRVIPLVHYCSELVTRKLLA
jgi:heat-inducible transcriptional repressor